ncbi:MAG: hypothetical protein HKK66_12120 [Chlorobiaceae bacterium]|nr:hypothetical protein [Chlorobiaceae bacterium]
MDVYSSNAIVLTDFFSVQSSKPLPQDDSLKLLTLGVTKAIAVKSGISSEIEVHKIFKKVNSAFKLFGATSKTIKHRCMVFGPGDYSDILAAKLVENDHFVNFDLSFPLYDDLIHRHSNPDGADLNKRILMIYKKTIELVESLYKGITIQPDDIIHVTSTGYIDPNPIDALANNRKWYDTIISNCYHRGCNASLQAIRMGHDFLKSSMYNKFEKNKSRIDIVHTEVNSAHMNICKYNPMNIIFLSEFSDGFIRYSLLPQSSIINNGPSGLKILSLSQQLIPDTINCSKVSTASPSFLLEVDTLAYIYSIKKYFKKFVVNLCHKVGIDYDKEKGKLVFAIQPSGAEYINKIGKLLHLADEQLYFSKNVMYEYGDMTSAGLPYIYRDILASDDVPTGTKVLGLGYAQGIILGGIVFEKV